ncbi:MAG: hypothetical protein O2894_13540 [Planctomycetota bacterium]|nr:hypothetical protein [Planctomycetota bacterium]
MVSTRWLVSVLVLLCALAPGVALAEEEDADAGPLADAKQLVVDMAAARKAKDASALETQIGQVAALHNGIEDKGVRGKLLKELGSLVGAKGFESLDAPAIEALAQLDDAKGAYKFLKKSLPGAKDKEPMSDLGRAALGAVAKLAPEDAIDDMLELAEKSRDYDAAALAIAALGQFKASKKRVMILEELVKLTGRFMPPSGQQAGEETMNRWKALGEPLVVACNTITGRRETTPDAWLTLWKDNKKKPDVLFAE